MIKYILKIRGEGREFQQFFSITKIFFSHSRSELFWQQNTNLKQIPKEDITSDRLNKCFHNFFLWKCYLHCQYIKINYRTQFHKKSKYIRSFKVKVKSGGIMSLAESWKKLKLCETFLILLLTKIQPNSTKIGPYKDFLKYMNYTLPKSWTIVGYKASMNLLKPTNISTASKLAIEILALWTWGIVLHELRWPS